MQKDLDIQEYTDPEHDPMIPYTLVLKPGLVVHTMYNGYWFWGRPGIDDLRRDLRAAMSEIRPDWDLSAPGLREQWEAGDFSSFHGWSRWSPDRRSAAALTILMHGQPFQDLVDWHCYGCGRLNEHGLRDQEPVGRR